MAIFFDSVLSNAVSGLIGFVIAIFAQQLWIRFGKVLGNWAGLKLVFTEDEKNFLSLTYSAVLICFVGVMFAALYLSLSARRYRDALRKSNVHRVDIWRDDPRNEEVSAYADCKTEAQRATSSIKVIGAHYGPEIDITDSHDDYLARGIMIALRRNAENTKRLFQYYRLVQVGEDVSLTELREQGLMRKHVGDVGMFLHIADALKLYGTVPGMDVQIYVRRYIASAPSILMIDQSHVYFSLPTRWHAPAPHSQPEWNAPKFKLGFVFGAVDNSGPPESTDTTVSQFQDLFLKLIYDAERVIRVNEESYAEARELVDKMSGRS
jgi:hypothetical protein